MREEAVGMCPTMVVSHAAPPPHEWTGTAARRASVARLLSVTGLAQMVESPAALQAVTVYVGERVIADCRVINW
jgi:hypothetical protein